MFSFLINIEIVFLMDASAYFYLCSVNSGLTRKVLIDLGLENNIYYAIQSPSLLYQETCSDCLRGLEDNPAVSHRANIEVER